MTKKAKKKRAREKGTNGGEDAKNRLSATPDTLEALEASEGVVVPLERARAQAPPQAPVRVPLSPVEASLAAHLAANYQAAVNAAGQRLQRELDVIFNARGIARERYVIAQRPDGWYFEPQEAAKG